MTLQELMSWRARTGILEQQKLANEQAMQKAVSQLDLRSPRTVYGYRPREKKRRWFGEGGTIPTVLSEIGGDAKSLFVDPVVPMIEGMKPRSPEENEKFLTENYPELGRDIQSRIAKTGVGARIGEQPVRRPAGYWQDNPNQGRGLNAVREDALMGVLGLSEFTPAGMAAPAIGGVVRTGLAKSGLKRLNEIANRMKGGWTQGKNIQGTPVGTRPQDILKRQGIVEKMAREGIGAKDWYKNVDDFMRKFFPSGRMGRELAAGLASPLSSSNPVKQNVKDMIRAYAQIKSGIEPKAGMYPSQTREFFREYEELIKTGQSPQVVKEKIFNMANKWRNFDKNLVGDLFAVTNDRYIRRLAGFSRGSTTKPQYNYMTSLIKDTADRLGIKPAEAQAAAWTAFKARWDAVQPGIQRWAAKKGWWDETANDVYSGKKDPVTGIKGPDFRDKYHDKIFNAAMRYKPSEKELVGAGQSFADLAQVGGMGVEFSPGLKFWPELGGAPKQVQDAYHDGMQKIFFRTSRDGRISHAQLDDMGIPHSVTPRTTGVYEGETSPGYYVQLLLPEDSAGVVHQSILNRLHAGIATMGRSSGQDAIGYYKMVDAPVGQADMYHMNIGRTLTDSETIKLEAGLQGLGLDHTVIPINRLDGVDIYYTDFKGGNGILDKDRFILDVEQYLRRGEWADTDTDVITTGIGKYKGKYFSYENLGPTGKEYKDGSREIHWENLANQSGAGEESARVHAVYSQQVKRFQSEFARTHGLPDPRFRHLENPQHPLSIGTSLREGFGSFPSRQQQLPRIIQPSFRRPRS